MGSFYEDLLNKFNIKHEHATIFLIVIMVLYATILAPKVPKDKLKYIESPYVKIILLFFIAYVNYYDHNIAMMLFVCLIITFEIMNRYNLNDMLIHYLEKVTKKHVKVEQNNKQMMEDDTEVPDKIKELYNIEKSKQEQEFTKGNDLMTIGETIQKMAENTLMKSKQLYQNGSTRESAVQLSEYGNYLTKVAEQTVKLGENLRTISQNRVKVLTYINDWIDVRENEILVSGQKLSTMLDEQREKIVKMVESLKLGEILQGQNIQGQSPQEQKGPTQIGMTPHPEMEAPQTTKPINLEHFSPVSPNNDILMDESIDVSSTNKNQEQNNFHGFEMSSSGYANF